MTAARVLQCVSHGDYVAAHGCPVPGCPRSVPATAAGLVAIRSDRDRLASLVEKLRPYLHHRPVFPRGPGRPGAPCPAVEGRGCNCGLSDLLAETETP